jgi:hypothetical protein
LVHYNRGLMADKQVTGKKTTTTAPKNSASKQVVAAAKPVASRVKTVKHSVPAKPQTVETAVIVPAKAPAVATDPHTGISRIAYGYYVARGYQGGNQAEDWFRAEAEYRNR